MNKILIYIIYNLILFFTSYGVVSFIGDIKRHLREEVNKNE